MKMNEFKLNLFRDDSCVFERRAKYIHVGEKLNVIHLHAYRDNMLGTWGILPTLTQ